MSNGDRLSGSLPPVRSMLVNFYYDDLAAARRWYVEALGLPIVFENDWVVMVEIGPGFEIALVDGARGALRAVAEKGAMLSIETDALDGWYDRIAALEDVRWAVAPGEGERPHISRHTENDDFRLFDPGGYLIEFYSWKPGYGPKA